MTPVSKEKAVLELGQALSGEKEFNTTFEIKTPQGARRMIGGRGKVFRDADGKPTVMYGINWDRTEEVNLAKNLELEKAKALQSARLASLGELSAGVAHEINNPLAVILGHLEMLDKLVDSPEKFQAKILILKKGVDRIAKIVSSLQKFSRTHESRPHQPFLLQNILREAMTFTEDRLQKMGIVIKVPENSEAQLICDELEMSQVFINLFNNAADAIKNLPEKWIEVQILNTAQGPKIIFRDSGPGISNEIQDKIFNPFFTTKPVGKGTGLGLSIVKGIVESHGGQISLRASDSHTCFEIQFPLFVAAS